MWLRPQEKGLFQNPLTLSTVALQFKPMLLKFIFRVTIEKTFIK